jgi:superfamily I DNA and RNA helicase
MIGKAIFFHNCSQMLSAVKANILEEVNAKDYDVIAIDEGQFFPDVMN